jgi:hypothetical protein
MAVGFHWVLIDGNLRRFAGECNIPVMPGFMPGIHVLTILK